MAVNEAEILSLYDGMINKMIENLNEQYDASRLDSNFYGQALVSLMQQTMVLATQTVQQQPSIEAEEELTDAKKLEQTADTIRKDDMQVEQLLLIAEQIKKLIADTAFTETQEIELTASVTYNNQIKALDSYSDMIGTMGAGSLTVSSDMWSKYFDMLQELHSSGSKPTNTVVDKVT